MEHGDSDGTVLSDDAGARAYAERIIRELKEGGEYDDPGLLMIVRDDAGRQIFAIPFATQQ